MVTTTKKSHWENIYQNKSLEEVSWYQPTPETSLSFFEEHSVPKDAKIIDIGGGDSFLVDHLLKKGYTDITVLDISSKAIERAKERLGEKATAVTWIVADAANFKPDHQYDVWHDRAAFHFLTNPDEIANYIKTAAHAINPGGILIMGTFSEEGPTKCSGIEIKQYSAASLEACFTSGFNKVKSFYTDHTTPSGSVQNFVFCSFKRK